MLLAVAGVRQALIADLLSLPTGGALSEMNLSPQRKKERTLEALLGLLEDLSRKRPVLMVFEDVHWIDPTSRELLDLTIDRIRRLPVLLIITFRPEFQEAWSGAAHVSTLLLNRLDAGEGTILAETVAGKALPDEVVMHIAARTDGVPLFVEELTRTVLESGLLRDEGDRYALDRPIPSFAIPPSLHACCWPVSTASARQPRKSRRSAPPSAAISPTGCWPRSRNGARQNYRTRLAGSSMQVWCFSAACPQTPLSCSSTRWCRTPPTAHCCAARARHCMSRSRKRSKPIPPSCGHPTRALRAALRGGRAR